MQRAMTRIANAERSDPRSGFKIGQHVHIANRGRAMISAQVVPGLWGVDFIDLKGFGYVFETEMTA